MDPCIMGTYTPSSKLSQPFYALREVPDTESSSSICQVLLKNEAGDFVWQDVYAWQVKHNPADPSVQIKRLRDELEEKSMVIQPLRENNCKQYNKIEQLEAKVRALEHRRKIQIDAITEKVLEAMEKQE